MKEQICERAGSAGLRDEEWRKHASGCADCGEVLRVSEWITGLAARTKVTGNIPAAGFIVVKSRIRKRMAAAERAERPLYLVFGFAGILFSILIVGMSRSETQIGSMMANAVTLIASQLGVVIAVVAMAAIACGVSAYLMRPRKQ